jgi:hypothetical protein
MTVFQDLQVHGYLVLMDYGNDVPGKSISPFQNGYEIYSLQSQLDEFGLHIVQGVV